MWVPSQGEHSWQSRETAGLGCLCPARAQHSRPQQLQCSMTSLKCNAEVLAAKTNCIPEVQTSTQGWYWARSRWEALPWPEQSYLHSYTCSLIKMLYEGHWPNFLYSPFWTLPSSSLTVGIFKYLNQTAVLTSISLFWPIDQFYVPFPLPCTSPTIFSATLQLSYWHSGCSLINQVLAE